MALRPLHQYELDKNHEPKLDKDGKKILHRKAGQPKKYSDYSPAEKKGFDDSIRYDTSVKKLMARRVLGNIAKAQAVLEKYGE